MTIRELIDACMTIGSEIGFDCEVVTHPPDSKIKAAVKAQTILGAEVILLK